MAFHCKPSGGYALGTQEASDNILEYWAQFQNITTSENVVGQLCNIKSESGFNPWRWQGDHVGADYSNGYGLYQFTPARSYINLTGVTGHSPNLSVTQVLGGNPSDALAQIWVFQTDALSKWVSTCWRPYWNDGQGNPMYPDLWAMRNRIITQYGSNGRLSMSEFYGINNADDACFAFLACYEGPAIPNYSERISSAQTIRDIIGGGPVPPTPTNDELLPILFLSESLK